MADYPDLGLETAVVTSENSDDDDGWEKRKNAH